jgi:hypothetical protein
MLNSSGTCEMALHETNISQFQAVISQALPGAHRNMNLNTIYYYNTLKK